MRIRASRLSAAAFACALALSSVSAAGMSPISRADFVTELTLSIYPPESSTFCYAALTSTEFTLLFADVSRDASFGPALCLGMVGGFINGYGDATFRPNNPVTFAEASKMIVKAFGLRTEPLMPKQPWYAPYANALAAHRAIPMTVMSSAHLVTMEEARDMIARVAFSDTTKESRTAEDMKKWMKAK